MNDYSSLSMAAARALAAAHAEAAPGRVAWLAGEVAATGGTAGDVTGGADRLSSLWAWLVERLRREGAPQLALATPLPSDDPQAGPRPPWHRDKPNRYMSDGLLWIVDAIGCHLAALAQGALPDASWQVHVAPSPRDVNHKRTVLAPVATPQGFADPARMVYGTLVGHAVRGEALPEDALTPLLDLLVGDAVVPAPALQAVPVRADDTAPVPSLPGTPPRLPARWEEHGDTLDAAGRREVARQLAQLPGLGIEPGGHAAGRDPQPGERWIALYDDVRVLVGDEAIDGMVDRLRRLDGVRSVSRTRREYVEVVATATDAQLRAWVIADLALHATAED